MFPARVLTQQTRRSASTLRFRPHLPFIWRETTRNAPVMPKKPPLLRQFAIDPEIYPMLALVGAMGVIGLSLARHKSTKPELTAPKWAENWAPQHSGYREKMLPEGKPSVDGPPPRA
ncbi:hypothetical protein THASP1DRAFT_30207 [Thamnocephalis sphaerospora]|uniref:NADH-ubiquinone reductase complex 1 MLRQ subunit-domain-containing protein n=1 Tax=Thamnocephalis sphaerospora TaxID=78915 RepID=A0A4P9XPP8_9FUNG|nr:hypothetical protein THASP1DRAFT_30207 [Thamnocephalis sphaerospora]|eukprot:RKP07987.1 hypothetical protein THASP1DRAFT_30207 [Thamnocephalis sphaerospora]